MNKHNLRLTGLGENPTSEEIKEWKNKMDGMRESFNSDKGKALFDCLSIFVSSGMDPENAMKMSVLMVEPCLRDELF